MTIQEVADALGLTYFAARQRIVRAGIKPISKEAIYPENTLELVKNSLGKGRPKKINEQKKLVIKAKKLRK